MTCKLKNSVVLNIIRRADSMNGGRLSKKKAFYYADFDGIKADWSRARLDFFFNLNLRKYIFILSLNLI